MTFRTSTKMKWAALILAFAGAWPAFAERGAPAATANVVDAETAAGGAVRCSGKAKATVFTRTELFFGLSRPGGTVSESEFKAFVDGHVTPRFPDGLTLLSGTGQFRGSNGAVVVEGAKLLILLVPLQDREADMKIEQIRREY